MDKKRKIKTLYIDKKDWQILKELAEKDGLSVSSWVRLLGRKHYEKMKNVKGGKK